MLSTPPVVKVLQMGHREARGQTEGGTDGVEDVSQIGSQADRQRQSLLRDTDRQAAGRIHWLFPRLHKQLQLWT